MREMQAQIISDLDVQPEIEPAEEVRRRIDFLTEYLRESGARGLVLGISGGQDSTLAGRLCQLATEELAAEGVESTFIAVRLPYNIQADEADAQLALEFIQPTRRAVFNVHTSVDAFALEYEDAMDERMIDFTKGNAKARARMIAQYAIAGQHGCLVVGTDHAAEAVTGFFTKFGDGGADVLPLSGLSKRQGKALLRHLGAPEQLYAKAPTADLLDETPGQTDEANLGITYNDIDDFLEGGEVPDAVAEAIENRYLATRHKRFSPVSPADGWWRIDRVGV